MGNLEKSSAFLRLILGDSLFVPLSMSIIAL
jgi:hypothetical protein